MPGFNINQAVADGVRAPSATVESVRLSRWSLQFDGIPSLGDVVLYAQSCQRPSFEIDTIVLHNKQNQIRMPGKYRWAPINVKFYEILDLNGNTTPSILFNYWSSGGNKSVADFKINGLNKDFRTTVEIYLEDGSGKTVHTYQLWNAWPFKIEPTELNFTTSDIGTTVVSLNYDSAQEKLTDMTQRLSEAARSFGANKVKVPE